MTKTDWTAEEVRDYADACRLLHKGPVIADMLDNLAKRIAADEGAVPVGYFNAAFGSLGFKLTQMAGYEPVYTHLPARVDKLPQLGGCCCGEPCILGTVHRTDGPCFVYEQSVTACNRLESAKADAPCSLSEALNVIENWAMRGNTLFGDDVDRFRALADKIAAAPSAQWQRNCPDYPNCPNLSCPCEPVVQGEVCTLRDAAEEALVLLEQLDPQHGITTQLRVTLATQGQGEEAKWDAIVQHCMVTEAVTPDEADPYGTISRVIDWHQANTGSPAGVPDEVARVAQHMAMAIEYIEKQYPNAAQLDRGPIMRNLRRWRDRLIAAPSATPEGGEVGSG